MDLLLKVKQKTFETSYETPCNDNSRISSARGLSRKILTKFLRNYNPTLQMITMIPIVVFIFVYGCSESPQADKNSSNSNSTIDTVSTSEQLQFIREVKDSLGRNVREYKRKEFILFCSQGSYADQNIDILFTLLDTAIGRIKSVLNIQEILKRFNLVMLDSRDEMNNMIGMKVKGLAYKRFNTGFFVFSRDIRPYFKHELFHLIANNLWGASGSRLLDEGGATYTDGECLLYEKPVSTINKYLFEKHMWFDIGDLINNFNEKARENDLIAYLQSAYIFKYLFENYGLDKMKDLWQNGFEQFEKIYGFDIAALQIKIEEGIRNIEYMEVDWNELMDKGCG